MLKYQLAYIKMAFDAIWQHKLRSFLSVLGVTIGIFCIIMVFTAVNSLEKHVKSSVESLGTDVLFIQKWPWTFGSNYPWWNYVKRPVPSYLDFQFLKTQLGENLAVASTFFAQVNGGIISNGNDVIEDVQSLGITHQYQLVQEINITDGRYFTDYESDIGINVAIIGDNLRSKLSLNNNDLGKEININKRPVKIIGYLKKQGENLLGKNNDNLIFMPFNYLNKFNNLSDESANPSIMVKINTNIPLDEAKVELIGNMRTVRKIKLKNEDNFAINQISMLTENLGVLFAGINIAGLMIGIFSVLVGGFGVANIMFVSVKERTHLIGIQKALGAKANFIKMQFLSEAVFLCLLGGIIGMLLVYLICLLGNFALSFSDNTFRLSIDFSTVFFGLIFSISIGILAGYFPANSGAKMQPVDAMRSGN